MEMMERKRKEEVVKEGRTSRREAVMEHRTATGREQKGRQGRGGEDFHLLHQECD